MVSGFKIFQKVKSQNYPPKGVIFIEQWKLIESVPSYEVSSLGRVRNLKTKKIIAQRINGTGYYQSNLYKEGKKITREVHRLVALAFIEGYEDGLVCNHIDENKLNNNAENLEWLTPKQNSNHGTAKERLSNTLTNNTKKSYPIKAINILTGEERFYPSLNEAERQDRFWTSAVSKILNGEQESLRGWTFIRI